MMCKIVFDDLFVLCVEVSDEFGEWGEELIVF